MKEVKRVALGSEQRTDRPAQFAHGSVRCHPVAFAVKPLHLDPRIHLPQNRVEPRHTAQHRILTDDDTRAAHVIGGYEAGGLITRADVFRKRVGDVARERCVERGAVLRMDLGEEWRHGFGVTVWRRTGHC